MPCQCLPASCSLPTSPEIVSCRPTWGESADGNPVPFNLVLSTLSRCVGCHSRQCVVSSSGPLCLTLGDSACHGMGPPAGCHRGAATVRAWKPLAPYQINFTAQPFVRVTLRDAPARPSHPPLPSRSLKVQPVCAPVARSPNSREDMTDRSLRGRGTPAQAVYLFSSRRELLSRPPRHSDNGGAVCAAMSLCPRLPLQGVIEWVQENAQSKNNFV